MSSISRRMGAPAFLCTLAVLVAGCGGNGTGPDEIERSDAQNADTFVRDMTFTATREGESVQLEGEESFGGPTITVVLEQ